MALKARIRALTSSAGLPFTAFDIIEAEDWLIEHPWPEILMSSTDPSSATSR